MLADFADKTIEIRMYPPHIRQIRDKGVGAGFARGQYGAHVCKSHPRARRSGLTRFTFVKFK